MSKLHFIAYIEATLSAANGVNDFTARASRDSKHPTIKVEKCNYNMEFTSSKVIIVSCFACSVGGCTLVASVVGKNHFHFI